MKSRISIFFLLDKMYPVLLSVKLYVFICFWMQRNADYKMYTHFMTLNTHFTETNLMTFVLTLVYNCAIYVRFTLA